jgi:signal transduction histidine kinase
MRDIVWFINPNEDTVEKMSLRMKDTAAVLLGGGKFVFETPDLDARTHLSPQFKRQFFLIFKESLHNVAKHSGATKVVIRLNVRNSTLILEVQDNGCGLRGTGTPRGNGLASMRRRAADQQWEFEIKTMPEGGIRVRLEARLDEIAGQAI